MKLQSVGLLLLTFISVCAVVIFVIVTDGQSNENAATPRSTTSNGEPVVLNDNSGNPSIPLNEAQKESTAPNQPTLQVLGGSDKQEAAPALPGPDDFLQYEQYKSYDSALFADTTSGTGATAATGDNVAVLYIGYLSDGTIFDQSAKKQDSPVTPFIFELGAGRVITGWEQGILGMREGGRRRLIVPPSVGYGSQKQGLIPANSLLIFDVELVAIQKNNQQGAGL